MFMFAAGDDYWSPDYVTRMIDVLDRDSKAVCAVSRAEFVKDGKVVSDATGTVALLNSPEANIIRLLGAYDDNSRMYGVFRTDVAKRAFPPRDFFAYDWAFTAGTLREGTHVEIPEVLMWRDHTNPGRYIEYIRRDANGAIERLLPMLPLTLDLLGRLRVPLSFPMISQLLRLNVDFHLLYLRRYHTSAYGVSKSVVRFLRKSFGFLQRRIQRLLAAGRSVSGN
jgi:hypothetical protein